MGKLKTRAHTPSHCRRCKFQTLTHFSRIPIYKSFKWRANTNAWIDWKTKKNGYRMTILISILASRTISTPSNAIGRRWISGPSRWKPQNVSIVFCRRFLAKITGLFFLFVPCARFDRLRFGSPVCHQAYIMSETSSLSECAFYMDRQFVHGVLRKNIRLYIYMHVWQLLLMKRFILTLETILASQQNMVSASSSFIYARLQWIKFRLKLNQYTITSHCSPSACINAQFFLCRQGQAAYQESVQNDAKRIVIFCENLHFHAKQTRAESFANKSMTEKKSVGQLGLFFLLGGLQREPDTTKQVDETSVYVWSAPTTHRHFASFAKLIGVRL